MRIDDACLVISDVDASDDFYSRTLGLQRRMRNVRFADFVFTDGPRLAVWMDYSIAETVGVTYPVGPGRPFVITLDGVEAGGDAAVSDPDGFVLQLRNTSGGGSRMSAIELSVGDLEESAGFIELLGFEATARGDDFVEFATPEVLLTLRAGSLAPVTAGGPALPQSTGRLMLAIELDTGEDVDRLYTELRTRGLEDSGPPRVYEWGSRSAYFVDHDGYIWEIYAWVETPR